MSDINVTVQDEIVNIDVLDTPVLVNVVNSPGQQGPAGPGVPVGGTAGQILAKASATNYDTEWINNYAKYLATNVRNQTGSTIGAFQVVYISGATGNKPLISLADADTEATSSKTYGVTATAIANNGTGDVVTAGELSGINTSAFNEGDLLWLSTTAGGVVTTPPAEPAHAVFIGYVVRSHPTLGTIDVSIQNGYELNELHGVQITSAANNDGLFYNSSNSLWENKTISTALGYTPVPTTRNITINGVTYDLSADRTWTIAAGISGSGASGQVTYWTGASAVSGSNNLFWDNAQGRLGIGTNAPAQALEIYAPIGRAAVRSTNNNQNSAFLLYAKGATGVEGSGGLYYVGNDAPTNRYFAITGDNTNYHLAVTYGGQTLIGATTNNGQRLQVYGDTLLRGSGNTNTTTALTVQNSDGTSLFRVQNGGQVFVDTGSFRANTIIGISGNVNIQGGTSGSYVRINAFANINSYLNVNIGTGAFTVTAGDIKSFVLDQGFAPTSGTATMSYMLINPTINQTGGANGITRGLYVNPTLTSAADFRAIETTAGNVLFGSNFFWDNANSRLGIGTNAPARPIDVLVNNNSAQSIAIKNSSNGLSARAGLISFNDINEYGGFTVQSSQFTNSTFRNNTSLVSSKSLIFSSDDSVASSGTSSIIFNTGGYNNNPTLTITGGNPGNVGIGVTPTVRLQVSGDTLLRGSGATSATTALTVQNSSSTNLFTVRNDGVVKIGDNIYNDNNSYLNVGKVGGGAARIAIANNSNYQDAMFVATSVSSGNINNWGFGQRRDTFFGNTIGSFQIVGGYIDNSGVGSAVGGGYRVPLICNPNGDVLINGGNANVVNGLIGLKVNAPTAHVDITASTTGNASLRIRSGTAPTTPNDGDIWFDGTDIKMRIGGVTKTFTLI